MEAGEGAEAEGFVVAAADGDRMAKKTIAETNKTLKMAFE